MKLSLSVLHITHPKLISMCTAIHPRLSSVQISFSLFMPSNPLSVSVCLSVCQSFCLSVCLCLSLLPSFLSLYLPIFLCLSLSAFSSCLIWLPLSFYIGFSQTPSKFKISISSSTLTQLLKLLHAKFPNITEIAFSSIVPPAGRGVCQNNRVIL